MKRLIYIWMVLMALLLEGCERRPLMELNNSFYVRVYVDENLKNVTDGFYSDTHRKPVYERPEILRLVLADPISGESRAERFLRNRAEDERGLYYDGYIVANPGTYVMMAYNFDTELTMIRKANNYLDAKAYTNEIASHIRSRIPSRSRNQQSGENQNAGAGKGASEKIVYEPDHLFVANCGEVEVPFIEEMDTLTTLDGDYFTATSIVKSYYLQVKVKGMKYATSSVGLLTGLSGSSWMDGGKMDVDDDVTVYFEMLPDENASAGLVNAEKEDDSSILYVTFNTFGKIPGAVSDLEITFDFLTVYGEPYSKTLTITDVFRSQEALENQWLLLDRYFDFVIEIPEPPVKPDSGGGFSPEVDEWGDVDVDIEV